MSDDEDYDNKDLGLPPMKEPWPVAYTPHNHRKGEFRDDCPKCHQQIDILENGE